MESISPSVTAAANNVADLAAAVVLVSFWNAGTGVGGGNNNNNNNSNNNNR